MTCLIDVRFVRFLAAALCVLSVVGSCEALERSIYALSGGTLLVTDRGTGSTASVGLSGDTIGSRSWFGLTADPETGDLFTSTGSEAQGGAVYTIDPETGTVQFVGAPVALLSETRTPISSDSSGLSFDPLDGTLYTVMPRDNQLIATDSSTGNGSIVGTISSDAPGSSDSAQPVAFQPGTGDAYLVIPDNNLQAQYLARLDLTTFQTTLGPAIGGSIGSPSAGWIEDLEFDPETGALIALRENQFFEVNLSTGASTPIDLLPGLSSSITDFAFFSQVPEPTAGALLLLTFTGLAAAGTRRSD